MRSFLLVIFAFLFALLWVALFKRLAIRYQIGSFPSPRKIHKEFVPLLGGVGIFFAILSTVFLGNILQWIPHNIWQNYLYFWIGLVIIVLTGFLDDWRGLNSWQKFLGQFLAAGSLVTGGCYFEAFVSPTGATLSLGVIAIPFSVLWIVFIINALNLLDGLDGLAGGISLMAALAFAIAARIQQQFLTAMLALAVAGAVLGFLRYNRHPASIFMGDAGSLQLGYILAFLSIEALKVAGSHHVYFLASLTILGLPVTDTLISFFRRLGKGTHPFKADREHIHHRLMHLSLKHAQTVWLMVFIAFLYAILGILMVLYSGVAGIILFVTAFVFSFFWVWRLGYLQSGNSQRVLYNGHSIFIRERPPLRWNRIAHQIVIFIGDVLAVNLALYFTYWFKFHSGLLQPLTVRSLQDYLMSPVFLFFTIGWVLLFWLNGLYNMPWDVSRFDKTLRVTRVITFGVLLLGLMTADPNQIFNRSQITTLAFYWVVMVVLVNGVRLAIIKIEKSRHLFEYSWKNTLIVGTSPEAQQVYQDIRSNPHLLYRVIGVVAENAPNPGLEDLPVLGRYDDLPELIRDHQIVEVIVALPEDAREDWARIIALCDPFDVVIKMPPSLEEVVSRRDPGLAGHALVRLFPENMVMWQWMVKRLMDILFALANGILLMPFWIFLALRVKQMFQSSVLVKVPVVGRNGRIFNMLLFRFTQEDYDYYQNPIYLGISQNRQLAGFSRFLYLSRLYKLPVMLNILKADMSLVGPRPEPPEWYQEFRDRLRFIHRRLLVRPGFTGLSQVKYRYEHSQKILQERIKYDLYYIENLSLRLDMRIILRSVILFFSRRRNEA